MASSSSRRQAEQGRFRDIDPVASLLFGAVQRLVGQAQEGQARRTGRASAKSIDTVRRSVTPEAREMTVDSVRVWTRSAMARQVSRSAVLRGQLPRWAICWCSATWPWSASWPFVTNGIRGPPPDGARECLLTGGTLETIGRAQRLLTAFARSPVAFQWPYRFPASVVLPD